MHFLKSSSDTLGRLLIATAISGGVYTAQASDSVSQILNQRNKTIDTIEKKCVSLTSRNECYASELRSLFVQLTEKDPAVYIPLHDELERYARDLDKQLSEYCISPKECDLSRAQIMLYTDISKEGQTLSAWLLEGVKNIDGGNAFRKYHFIGASKISSGYPDKKPRKPATDTKFATGTGVFTTNPTVTGVIGYRAEGTKNKNGIRGYGEKGNRVYDIGSMKTKRGWDGSDMDIRFMIHSTDPVLEARF